MIENARGWLVEASSHVGRRLPNSMTRLIPVITDYYLPGDALPLISLPRTATMGRNNSVPDVGRDAIKEK